MLLAGPPGLGKTSLARIIAEELDVPFVQTAGPALERKGDIAAFLTDLEPRAVFFVDEIHRLPRAVEETFYPAMEDGAAADHVRHRPGREGGDAADPAVHADRRDHPRRPADARRCATASASSTGWTSTARTSWRRSSPAAPRVLNVPVHMDGARAIAERSRGTPRVANRLLKRVRDYAQVHGDGTVDAAIAYAALDAHGRRPRRAWTAWTARSST